jgi:hypothetical protein
MFVRPLRIGITPYFSWELAHIRFGSGVLEGPARVLIRWHLLLMCDALSAVTAGDDRTWHISQMPVLHSTDPYERDLRVA